VLQILRPPRIRLQSRSFLRHPALELVKSDLVDQELQSSRVPILLLAIFCEYPTYGKAERKQFLLRNEVGKELRLLGNRPETAAHVKLEPALAVANHADGTDVVERDETARLVLAAGKRNLELPAIILRAGVTEHEVRGRLRIGRDVEGLGPANARDRASGHVADRIAARFASRDPDGSQPAHDRRGVFDVDIVKLEILAGGNVRDRVGILFRKFSEHFQLPRVQSPEWNLDALHPGRIP
jgi:hypothetical protein